MRRSGTEAVLEVRDHGPGIPDAAREHVFERFWRGEAGRARGAGGSGLGLAIVRELLAAQHGTVSAANHAEGGAVFTVRLPAASWPSDGHRTDVDGVLPMRTATVSPTASSRPPEPSG